MRSAFALLLSAAACAALGAPLRAQQLWTFSVNPSFGANLYLSKLPPRFNIRGKETDVPVLSGNLTNIVTMRNSLGVRYGRFVGLEAVVTLSPSNLQSSNQDDMSVDIVSYGLNGSLYLPLSKSGHEIFLSGGYGLKRYDFFYFRTWSENAWTWNLGTGANLPINNRIAVHLEARDHVSTFNSNIVGVSAVGQNDLTLSIGINMSVNGENR